MTWEEIPVWLITAFVGALIVKGLDLLIANYNKKKHRNEEKVTVINELLDKYGELIDLYRIRAHIKSEVKVDEEGQPIQVEDGKYLVEKTVLEPEAKFVEPIRELTGADIDTAVALQITDIRLTSSKPLDYATELDKTGQLKEDIYELEKSIFSLETILKHKDLGDTYDKFIPYSKALNEADNTRRQIRKNLESYT